MAAITDIPPTTNWAHEVSDLYEQHFESLMAVGVI